MTEKSSAAALLLLTVSVSLGCTAKSPANDTTPQFKAFADIKSKLPQRTKEVTAGAYTYRLHKGQLSISDTEGRLVWTQDSNWWVDDFHLGDVDGDGQTDFLFSLWKSYSFGSTPPARFSNDDASVKNHLFLYTIRAGRTKQLWCSSNLPRPIYHFELDPSGRKTPVSSGMLLRTKEGEYTEDYHETAANAYLYAWESWGFVPQD
ncbi:hypothetical protein ACYULU_03305 [Breznakiellaceae bacterium SP9]